MNSLWSWHRNENGLNGNAQSDYYLSRNVLRILFVYHYQHFDVGRLSFELIDARKVLFSGHIHLVWLSRLYYREWMVAKPASTRYDLIINCMSECLIINVHVGVGCSRNWVTASVNIPRAIAIMQCSLFIFDAGYQAKTMAKLTFHRSLCSSKIQINLINIIFVCVWIAKQCIWAFAKEKNGIRSTPCVVYTFSSHFERERGWQTTLWTQEQPRSNQTTFDERHTKWSRENL